MANTNVDILINAKDNASGSLRNLQGALGHLESSFGSVARIISGTFKVAAGGLVIAAGGMAVGVKKAVTEFAEAELVGARLAAVLKSTGNAAGFTAEDILGQADALSKLSNFSDEAVTGGLNRLLTYTGIQGDMFKQAGLAAVDMATALEMDLGGAAEKVGNALQYPSEALGSLTKQGFRFTEDRKSTR